MKMTGKLAFVCLMIARVVEMEIVSFRKSTEFMDTWIIPPSARILHNSSHLTLTQCGRTCAANLACLSFFYSHKTWQCQTHDTVFRSAEDGARTTGSQYFVAEHENCKMEEALVYNRALNVCIWINGIFLHWKSARAACSEVNGSQLVTVNSEDKYNFVVNILKSSSDTNGRTMHIGLSDVKVEGRFQWLDSTLLSWEPKWFPISPPVHDDTLNCVVIKGKGGGNYLFRDIKCLGKHFKSICDKLLLSRT